MKKIAIIVAIIMCIGVFTACMADKTGSEITTTNTTTTTTQPVSGDGAQSTSVAPSTPAINTGITVKEALDALSDKYGDKYTVRATILEDDIQYFSIEDKDSGEKYAKVSVVMSTAQATETIMETQEQSTFNLNG